MLECIAVAYQTRCDPNEPSVSAEVVCDCSSSRLLSSSTENQNRRDDRGRVVCSAQVKPGRPSPSCPSHCSDFLLRSAMNRSSIGRSGCQYHEYCLEHCMGLVVTLQYNGTRDLRGCMIMQSTTWPWRVEVYCCRQSNALQSKRTWRVGESRLRFRLLIFATAAIEY